MEHADCHILIKCSVMEQVYYHILIIVPEWNTRIFTKDIDFYSFLIYNVNLEEII